MGYCSVIRFTCVLLVTVDILIAGTVRAVQLTVSPPGNVREGDTVTVTCRSPGMSVLDSLRLVRRIKGNEYEVVTNDYVKERYQQTGRYWVTKWDGGQGLLVLQISHISGQDAGNWGCKHLPSGEGIFRDIIVDVKPTSVELWYEALDRKWYRALDDDKVQFQNQIRCNVTVVGTDFEPKVSLSIYGKDLTAKKTTYKLVEDDSGLSRLVSSVAYTITLDGKDLKLHGKNLTCTATTPQHQPINSSITLEIPHKPQIFCASEWHARPCEENYAITCNGHMFPSLKSYIWSWTDKAIRYEIINGENTNPNISRFHTTHAVSTTGEHQFRLLLDEIKRKDFGEYQLRVTNDFGSTVATIQLTIEHDTVTRRPTTTELFVPHDYPVIQPGDSSRFLQVTSGSTTHLGLCIILLATCSLLPRIYYADLSQR